MKLQTSLLIFILTFPVLGQPYYVAPNGDDRNPGTIDKPFASLERAQQAVRQNRGSVFLRNGTYYLPKTMTFIEQDSGSKDNPVVFLAFENERPVISGGIRLEKLD